MGTPLKSADRFPRRALSVAAAVSLVAAPAFTGTAHAADPVKKAIKISAKQFPTAFDRPATAADMVRLSNVAGIKWTVDGTVQDLGTSKTKSVPVTKPDVVVKAEVTDAAKNFIAGPSEWTVTFATTASTVTDSDVAVTWVDGPLSKDSVILPKVPGVLWKVDAAEYAPEDFGKKTELQVKATTNTTVIAELLGATAADGATFPKTIANPLKSEATVTYEDAVAAGALSAGDNPFDKGKGYGKGASIETVKVVGVAGLKWRIGTGPKAKAVAVKPGVVAYLRVDPSDLADDGKVSVTPVPDKGYALTTSPVAAVVVDLKDGANPPPIAVVNAVGSGSTTPSTDRGGAGSDTLVMRAERNMTWWFGQEDAKTKKIVYKAQKAGKDGNATYKVKHVKGATATDVYVKPVADRGYVIDSTGLTVPKYSFAAADVSAGKGFAVTTNAVTLTPTLGIDSWVIEDTVAGKIVKTTIKRADLVAAGTTKAVVPTTAAAATVTTKYVKGYKE